MSETPGQRGSAKGGSRRWRAVLLAEDPADIGGHRPSRTVTSTSHTLSAQLPREARRRFAPRRSGSWAGEVDRLLGSPLDTSPTWPLAHVPRDPQSLVRHGVRTLHAHRPPPRGRALTADSPATTFSPACGQSGFSGSAGSHRPPHLRRGDGQPLSPRQTLDRDCRPLGTGLGPRLWGKRGLAPPPFWGCSGGTQP